jgi:putative copper export protein
MQSEPLLHWADPVKEFIGFVALFLGAGAIGFRYFALRGVQVESDRDFASQAARRAAWLGALGVILSLIMAGISLPGLAARAHVAVPALFTSQATVAMQFGFLVLALVGFFFASTGSATGWALAAVGVIAGALRSVFLGQWSRLINPVHSLAAGLWLGTLFVLVIAGLALLFQHEPSVARRGAIAAAMVNGFSPLALTMGGVVVLFGVITAWRHLHVLSNLWATPYGIALIVKLLLVALVFTLGAWNWRRQRPMLGSEPAAMAIRRSSAVELTVTTLVLIATAIVVSLPSPKG